jgi:succinate dehydrogenase / fumarate reductase cytochrome b subunit
MADALQKSVPLHKSRPRYTNLGLAQLIGYRLPVTGWLSILHRVSGALMFLALPAILLPLLDLSLTTEDTFDQVRELTDHWWVKLPLFLLLWSYLHHFCAGIRYLVLDRHIGIDKEPAKLTAWIVFGVSLALTVVLGYFLWSA